ncbi:MAG: hypothetical protein BGO55_17345 [Sphingobacteriales bacterium 50-39]|nr:MAG: hypothetical protein BGO55_17345 [Sphingobacteriales bacterium 50-39]
MQVFACKYICKYLLAQVFFPWQIVLQKIITISCHGFNPKAGQTEINDLSGKVKIKFPRRNESAKYTFLCFRLLRSLRQVQF